MTPAAAWSRASASRSPTESFRQLPRPPTRWNCRPACDPNSVDFGWAEESYRQKPPSGSSPLPLHPDSAIDARWRRLHCRGGLCRPANRIRWPGSESRTHPSRQKECLRADPLPFVAAVAPGPRREWNRPCAESVPRSVQSHHASRPAQRSTTPRAVPGLRWRRPRDRRPTPRRAAKVSRACCVRQLASKK